MCSPHKTFEHQTSEDLHINEVLCQWLSASLLSLGCNECQVGFDVLEQPLPRVRHSPAWHRMWH